MPPPTDHSELLELVRELAGMRADLAAVRRMLYEHGPRRRDEVASKGLDIWRQLAPDAFGNASNTGIQIPPEPGFSYRALVGVVDLDAGDVLVGLRQMVMLLARKPTGSDAPDHFYPFWFPVTSATWRFVDGGTTWTLTEEPFTPKPSRQGPFDSESFVWRDADAPAMLYETAGFPMAPRLPGYLGLNDYTAPPMRGTPILVTHDLRWPFQESQSNSELWIPVKRPMRYRFYCDVLQTGGITPPAITAGTPPLYVVKGIEPEEQYLQIFGRLAIYGSVAARMIWQSPRRDR